MLEPPQIFSTENLVSGDIRHNSAVATITAPRVSGFWNPPPFRAWKLSNFASEAPSVHQPEKSLLKPPQVIEIHPCQKEIFSNPKIDECPGVIYEKTPFRFLHIWGIIKGKIQCQMQKTAIQFKKFDLRLSLPSWEQ
jgi:hypothetical protein